MDVNGPRKKKCKLILKHYNYYYKNTLKIALLINYYMGRVG